MEELTLAAVVVVALFFDFTNGFHDSANSIATSVSTRAMSPRAAVGSSAVLNFAGAFVSLEVAATIASGIVDAGAITLDVVLAGLVGAITWNLITWYFGLPSSSSHALIGGILGSAVAAAGWDVVNVVGIRDNVLIPSLIAPTRPARTTSSVIASGVTIPLAIVAATSSETNAPAKLRTAALATAARGVSARVETLVAIELALS